MFGGSSNNSLSSPTKDSQEGQSSNSSSIASNPNNKAGGGPGSIPNGLDLDAVEEDSPGSIGRSQSLSLPRQSQEHGEKKRRSSGFGKAGALFANAKQSLHLTGSSNANSEDGGLMSPTPSAIAKLGKTDPDLSVPQGSLNNSAGESRPGPRATFRVGVTEDKNKKCRRTMEDTHAYLYNFLSTPAPNISSDAESTSSAKRSDPSKEGQDSRTSLASEKQVMETDNGYFAIFDGHAGTFAADWCGKKLHVLLEEAIRKSPNTPVPELLDQTFTSVDQQLDKLPLKNSGCTAICAVLRWEDRIPNSQSATGSTAIAPAAAAALKAASDPPPSYNDSNSKEATSTPSAKAAVPGFASKTPLPKLQSSATRQRVLYTANVGDARIVLCRNGKALRLSYDHKGSDENEGKRISNAGGLILNNRVNGVLAVTRALGDSYMKELVTGHPYTTETVVQPDIDEFLILACDGLWDVCSDQEAVDLVRHTPDPQEASKLLVDHALTRFSTDNLSCMIVRFDSKALHHSLQADSSTPIPQSNNGEGVSEVDKIVAEARKSVGDLPANKAEVASLKEEAEKEAEEEQKDKEAGPEVDGEALGKERMKRGSVA